VSPAQAEATPRWRRLEHDERRAQILAVARELFSERSYADVPTAEIATAAGIRRGLLHHYFGSKRELFLEVVRDILAQATMPFDDDHTLAANVERCLDFVEQNTATWFAVLGAEGFGHDREIEALVARARDATVERIIAVLGIAKPTDELRAVLRAFGGVAEVTTREWLQRRTISRAQAAALLTSTLLALVREVVPAVESARSRS
jgi:AcrR family transcriptional regulator